MRRVSLAANREKTCIQYTSTDELNLPATCVRFKVLQPTLPADSVDDATLKARQETFATETADARRQILVLELHAKNDRSDADRQSKKKHRILKKWEHIRTAHLLHLRAGRGASLDGVAPEAVRECVDISSSTPTLKRRLVSAPHSQADVNRRGQCPRFD